MHQSFLAYARFRYLKAAGLLVVLSVVLYAWHEPAAGAYGGSWLGYTLGGIGAAIILLLLWFGIRKRQYGSQAGTLAGWLSAHVYLGLALAVISTLHAGFQLGWNIHSLAYVLTLLVIASGAYGVFTYLRYPDRITENRVGMRSEAMLAEIADLDREALQIADQLSPRAHEIVLRSIASTAIGGGVWDLLRARAPQRRTQLQESTEAELSLLEKDTALGWSGDEEQSTMVFMADRLSHSRGSEQVAQVRRLLDLVSRKKALVERMQRDVQFHALMQAWLYVHVPLSLALLAALLVHVLAVFFYW